MSEQRRSLDPEAEAEVVRLYRDGATLAEITEATGVARSSIYWVLRKHDITPDRLRAKLSVLPAAEGLTMGAEQVEWFMGEAQSLSARLDDLRDCVDEAVRTLTDNQRRIDDRLIQLRGALDANTQAVLRLLADQVTQE
ncbi:MAG: helix-turn-helix domain-containing protein [Actinomycetota bacterium]|nr:helix-turn-helix domain-containing protein [Actinomycetota bacterium]